MSIRVSDLSPDQAGAYRSIVDWMRGGSSRLLSMGGYSGTGKSTLVSMVARQTNLPAFCAYTGKAASVLKRKLSAQGVTTSGTCSEDGQPFCGTIHSLIYRPCECLDPEPIQKPCPKCGMETRWVGSLEGKSLCDGGHGGQFKTYADFRKCKAKLSDKKGGGCEVCGGKGWLRRDCLDRGYSLIVVDEASMVDDVVLRDLSSYEVPILAVGDHGQLPPVRGRGSLMVEPHIRLEKVHRQAAGSPIISLSVFIRENGYLPSSFDGGEAVQFLKLSDGKGILDGRYSSTTPSELMEMVSVCYDNRRRVRMNTVIRGVRGVALPERNIPQEGEQVIVLRNMKALPPVFNGMRGLCESAVKEARGGVLEAEVSFPEDGMSKRKYELLHAQFNREKTFADREEMAKETGLFHYAGGYFDYGYTVTGHKCQGSQFRDVLLVADKPNYVSADGWRRWLYTCSTRSSEKLTILR